MILSQITSSIARLHNHLLAGDRAARKRKFVAGAAPCGLRLSGDAHGGPAVAQRLADGPGALVRAHVRRAAVVAARARGAVVVERGVRLRACPDEFAAVRLHRPGARGLAAVPVPRGLPRARGALGRGHAGEGEGC
ncbi:hypothetical protein RRF57_012652 [Xylaria bambusicola]|uniref:Uncharacterized protein n=1 Tax=Xylaria bambusicola TaxID=326684 RepID=A0AAN7V0T3_9PEZI